MEDEEGKLMEMKYQQMMQLLKEWVDYVVVKTIRFSHILVIIILVHKLAHFSNTQPRVSRVVRTSPS